MDFTQFIKPELLVLVPVLWLTGAALKKTPQISDWLIPYILGGAGILLAAVYVCAAEGISAMSIFTAITQGALVAGASVWGNQLVKQARKSGGEGEKKDG